MTLILPWNESLHQTRHETLARIRALNEAITAATKSRAKRRSHTLNQLLPKHRRKNQTAQAQAP